MNLLDRYSQLSSDTRRRIADAVVVGVSLAVGIAALLADFEESVGDVSPVDIGFVVVGCAALLARHRWSIPVAVVVVVMRLATILVSKAEIPLVAAVIVAFYALARTVPRRSSYGLAIAASVLSTVAILSIDEGESLPQELLGESAAMLLPVALGDATRSRHERLAAIIEAEASSRVQAERLRIARDLHDVVAHGLATIAVQSGTAAYNLGEAEPDDPVRVALERINATGKRSLEELRGMVGVLRSTDEAPIRPTPTEPDDLTDLVEAAALANVALHIDVDGTFPEVSSDATIVAAHRIAQEALTNVARHAGAVPATLEMRHHHDRVVLRVVNQTSATPGSDRSTESTGVGIVGMRERAESVGGTLETHQLVGNGFEVRAELPYRQAAR